MAAWDGIEEFAAVASTGSFTAGARMLGLSVTHMSRSVAQLEGRLQTRLLNRTTRSVSLTDTGRTFLDHSQRLIAERDEAIALVSEKGEPQGELRITCSTAMGERFVAPIARRFLALHPKVSLSIELTNRLIDIVAEGYDLAVRTGPLNDPRLIGTEVATRAFVTCTSPAYLNRRGMPDEIGDLDRHDCLIGTASLWHFQIGQRERSYRPNGRFRCNSGEAVTGAALEGLGICQLPQFYVHDHLLTGRLVPVLDQYRLVAEPIWAVYPQRRHLSPKISRFVNQLSVELPALLDGTR